MRGKWLGQAPVCELNDSQNLSKIVGSELTRLELAGLELVSFSYGFRQSIV